MFASTLFFCYSVGAIFVMSPLFIAITALVVLLLIFVIFSFVKGAFRVVIYLGIVGIAAGTWLIVQHTGLNLLSMLTPHPEPWMVDAFSIAAALVVFGILLYAVSWFSHLISGKSKGFSFMRLIVNMLMISLAFWVMTMAFFYAGNIAKVDYYYKLATAHNEGGDMPEQSAFLKWSLQFREHSIGQRLLQIDLLDNPAQTNLACLITYGCLRDKAGYEAFYQSHLAPRNIPHPTRFLSLFSDEGLREMVKKRQYVNILENEKLHNFLLHGNSEEILKKIL